MELQIRKKALFYHEFLLPFVRKSGETALAQMEKVEGTRCANVGVNLPLTTTMMPRTHSSSDLAHILAPSPAGFPRRKKSVEELATRNPYVLSSSIVRLMRGIDRSSDRPVWSISQQRIPREFYARHHCRISPEISRIGIKMCVRLALLSTTSTSQSRCCCFVAQIRRTEMRGTIPERKSWWLIRADRINRLSTDCGRRKCLDQNPILPA